MRELIKKLLPGPVRDFYKILRHCFIRAEFALFSLFPIKKDRIAFCNVWGYGDNPKWIAEALLKTGRKLDIRYITDKKTGTDAPRGIRLLQNNLPAAVYTLATSKVWVDCNRKEPYIMKRRRQFYIQTWHGSLPLKKIEHDCSYALTKSYLKNADRDSAMTDLYLSNSTFCSELYRRAFKYRGKILKTGTARVDILLKPDAAVRGRIRKRLGISTDSGIALYAPTYRDESSPVKADGVLDYEAVINALNARFQKDFSILVRLHPLAKACSKTEYTDKVLNANGFGDIYELLAAADVLITDYSNTLFEFAYTEKPVFLYAPDAEIYGKERGFYFDYDSLPYPHAQDETALCSKILDYRHDYYISRQKEMFEKLGIFEDGNASARIAQLILKKTLIN